MYDVVQAVRALVRQHFGDEEAPFELPLTAKLFVMKNSAAATASASAAATAAAGLRSISSSSGSGCEQAGGSSTSSSAEDKCSCGCGPEDGCMQHHVRTRRSGLSSRDSCTLRHLFA